MSAVLLDTPSPGIARLRLNRPEARNAIDAELRIQLLQALQDVEADEGIRALILAGAGEVFCAGGDLPTLVGITAEAASARMAHGHAVVTRLWRFPKPVVAAVKGFAVGAGAGVALMADHVVLARDGFLSFPFLKLGLVPDWGLPAVVPWRCGHAVAARAFREASKIPAAQALAWNLVDELAEPELVMASALETATAMADLPGGAFARMKHMLRPDISTLLAEEAVAQVSCVMGAEFQEGYAAFRERRAPRFGRIGVSGSAEPGPAA